MVAAVQERSPAPPTARASGWSPLLLAPAGVLALLGTALLLRRPSLWYDELFTAQVAPLPLWRLLEAVRTGEGTATYLLDVPPSYNAPYYVVVHLWLLLTGQEPGELSLRSLSLLAAVAGVAVLTAAVARLGGRAAGLAAGLLAATNPLVLEYSVEARGYGLALLAVAVTGLGLARWLDGHGLLLFAVGATAAGLAHWFALPVVAGLAVAGLLLRRRAALPLLVVSALGAAADAGAGRARADAGHRGHHDRLDRRHRWRGAVAVAAGLDGRVDRPARGHPGAGRGCARARSPWRTGATDGRRRSLLGRRPAARRHARRAGPAGVRAALPAARAAGAGSAGCGGGDGRPPAVRNAARRRARRPVAARRRAARRPAAARGRPRRGRGAGRRARGR